MLIKRFIIALVLLDNYITNTFRGLFPKKWRRIGKCLQCGNCCKKILLQMTPTQTRSPLFRKLAIGWIAWLFDFVYLGTDFEYNYLLFTCKHLQTNGKCGNYFWRPNICRNYPLVDYFNQPSLLPGCGYSSVMVK